MPGNSAVKSTAKALLRKNWPPLIACAFLLIAAVFIELYVESVFLLLMGELAAWAIVPFKIFYSLLLFFPLLFGVIRFVWLLGGDRRPSLDSIFYYFSDSGAFLKSVKFTIGFSVRIIFSAFGAFLPYIAVMAAHGFAADFVDSQAQMHLMFLSTILSVLGIVMFAIFSVRYYISPLLFVGSEQLEVAEIFHLSKLISRKTAGAYIVLVIGMLGWIILSALGITLVLTLPYMLLCYTVHCRYAVYFHNHRARLSRETDFFDYRSSF